MASSTVELDRRYVWHPFTPIDSWLDPSFEPLVIVEGSGAELVDEQGRRYLDGNSTIWTNIHGHRHPALDAAIERQLRKIAHVSALGFANRPAAELAARLCRMLEPEPYRAFFSDDGSTAIEAALKIAFQYFHQNGQPQRTRFVSLEGGYHGDTVGAMSVGQSGAFHAPFRPLMFAALRVPSPGCYRCPCNNAAFRPADARTYAPCAAAGWDGAEPHPCLDALRELLQTHGDTVAALVVEPRVQGANGMAMQPSGYLQAAARLAREAGALLIVDEVMTGMGRTGTFFAFQHETGVVPDLIALAKGLTGGYLPFAATLVREFLFEGFRGELGRTFFHGHSYCGNPLGAAAALACLETFETERTLDRVARLIPVLQRAAQGFWDHPHVGDVRQEGLILAIELVADRATKQPFSSDRRLAWHISERARGHGLLTRGIGSTLILMPPLCATPSQIERMAAALRQALFEVLPPSASPPDSSVL